jgi:hypothetical protein
MEKSQPLLRFADFTAKWPPMSEKEPQGAGIVSESATIRPESRIASQIQPANRSEGVGSLLRPSFSDPLGLEKVLGIRVMRLASEALGKRR